jgi:lauroyl/myristoyl acyltransferase
MNETRTELTDEERAILSSFGRMTGRMAQRSLRDGFRAKVDRAFPGLDPEEREKRADQLFRAHMSAIAAARQARLRSLRANA